MMVALGVALTGAYDPRLVALSVAIAIVASYTALDLAGRVTAARGLSRAIWLAGGAGAMGVGIWSMHFVGMLAFSLHVPLTYDVPTIAASLLVAILASGLALFLVSRRAMGRRAWLAGGLLMGVAIVAMHYIGMGGMRMQGAMTTYNPVLVALSLAIAIGVSLVALWLAFRLRRQTRTWNAGTVGSAVLMGIAISGMHYTGMAAAVFSSTASARMTSADSVRSSVLGASALGLATLLVLGGALLTALVDRRRALHAAVAEERAQLLAREQAARAEATARAAQLEATFAAIGDGIITYNRVGRIVQTNPAAQALLALTGQDSSALHAGRNGRRHDEASGEHARPLDHDNWPLQRILRGEALTGPHVADVTLRATDGRELQLNVSGAPVRDMTGHVSGAVVVFRDVTERRRLERRTHEALDALLAMAGALVQGHVEAASDDVPDTGTTHPVMRRLAELAQRVLACRRVCIVLLEPETALLRPVAVAGATPGQEASLRASLRGARLHDRFGPTQAARLANGEAVALREEPDALGARRLLVPVRADAHLIGFLGVDYGDEAREDRTEEGALAGAVAGLVAAVLERERLQREREEARTAERALREANRRMEEFLSIAGHELRTPLTSVLGNTQLATQWMDQVRQAGWGADAASFGLERLDKVSTLLRRMEHQGRVLNRLVHDLLDSSRIQTGHLALRPEPCDLVALVREAVQEQQQRTPRRTVHLEMPAGRVFAVVDQERITQVLFNYLSNALKFSAHDQPVTVGVRVEGTAARVWVRDAGPGLPSSEHERVWGRFYRAADTMHRDGSSVGLGLGLYISRSIVERHGGRVGVESVPGAGATFWFSVPLAAGAAHAATQTVDTSDGRLASERGGGS